MDFLHVSSIYGHGGIGFLIPKAPSASPNSQRSLLASRHSTSDWMSFQPERSASSSSSTAPCHAGSSRQYARNSPHTSPPKTSSTRRFRDCTSVGGAFSRAASSLRALSPPPPPKRPPVGSPPPGWVGAGCDRREEPPEDPAAAARRRSERARAAAEVEAAAARAAAAAAALPSSGSTALPSAWQAPSHHLSH